MTPQISVHQIEKSFAQKVLFHQLSFGIQQGQRLALLGPNGAGKSTLLKILCGIEDVDGGEVTTQNSLSVAYVPQDDIYPQEKSVYDVACQILSQHGFDIHEAEVQAAIYLSQAGFEDFEQKAGRLSGGWRKRLSLAIALAKECDVLLLDEPTNHLDWEGILWLEGILQNYRKTLIVISHDREFLKNQCREFMEINPGYANGFFAFKGSYEEFLEKKAQYLAGELSRQSSLSNKVRRETEWLRAGVKARTTKSTSRSKEAHGLIDQLSELKSRNQSVHRSAQISVDHAGKKSKQFYQIEDLSIFYDDNVILKGLTLRLGPKQALGVLGSNASGKTSLIRVLTEKAKNYRGSLKIANDLKVVYFDQKREHLDPEETPQSFLGDGSDHLHYRGESVHVFSYASRFLFTADQMGQPIHKLSGGEKARLLVAKLLAQPADVFVLDEPTNDLDLNTIEILEEGLKSFPGLVILVSHDRYFLRHICKMYLGLDGHGGWETYASLDQWLKPNAKKSSAHSQAETGKKSVEKKTATKVKLSYKEKRALETIESDIAQAEQELEKAQNLVEQNTDFSNHNKTSRLLDDLRIKQKNVEELYQLWQKLENKNSDN